MILNFKYNEYGVCINPKIYGKVGSSCIKVAEYLCGKWIYGLIAKGQESTACFPCMITNVLYNSEREAVLEAIRSLQRLLENRDFKDGNNTEIEQCLSKAFDEVSQLSLF